MLFCFGLFALLLYYTVVANAECSYTFWNSSQHIEAQSADYERQGFQRCEFLIQASAQHGVELNFTRITGFGALSMHAGHTQEEEEADGGGEETEEEKEGSESEGQRTDKRRGRGRGKEGWRSEHSGGGGGGVKPGQDVHGTNSRYNSKSADGSRSPSQGGPRFVTSSSALLSNSTPRSGGSKLSSILSSPTPPPVAASSTTVFVKSETLVEVSTTTTTPSKKKPGPSSPKSSVLTDGSSTKPSVNTDDNDDSQVTKKPPCLPMVEIREVLGEGREETRHVICRQRHNYQTPVVFHYASSVRIVYEWEEKRNSGFTLYFDFSKEDCVLKCDGDRCLRDSQLLCDGHYDCQDKADEQQPACQTQLQSSAAATRELDSGSLVKIIVIPTCLVVLIVLSIACLLGRHHCHALSHTMHHRHANSHTGHLTCQPSHSSEGLTPSAGSTQECSEQAVALLPSAHHHHHHTQHKKWSGTHPQPQPHPSPPPPPRDPEIDLPPNIPVSPDGEEGYVASQVRLLHPRYCMVQSELFKAPPNKTVFDRESPPPYSLSPAHKSFGCSSAPPITSRSGFVVSGEGFAPVSGTVRMVRDSQGQPVVSRCYTMFTQSTRDSMKSFTSGGRGGSAVRMAGVARDSGSSPRQRDNDRHSRQQQQCYQQRQQPRPRPRPRPPPPLSPPYRGAYNTVKSMDGFHPIPAITPINAPTRTPPILVVPPVSVVDRQYTQDQNLHHEHAPRGRGGSRGRASQGNSCDSRGSPPPAYNELALCDTVNANNKESITRHEFHSVRNPVGVAFSDTSNNNSFSDAANTPNNVVGRALGDSVSTANNAVARNTFSETPNGSNKNASVGLGAISETADGSNNASVGRSAFSETSRDATPRFCDSSVGRAFGDASSTVLRDSGNVSSAVDVAFADATNANNVGVAFSDSGSANGGVGAGSGVQQGSIGSGV